MMKTMRIVLEDKIKISTLKGKIAQKAVPMKTMEAYGVPEMKWSKETE